MKKITQHLMESAILFLTALLLIVTVVSFAGCSSIIHEASTANLSQNTLHSFPLFCAGGIAGEGGEAPVAVSSIASDEETPPVENKEEKEEKEKKGGGQFRQDEISITATRTERLLFETPRALSVADKKEMERENQGTAIDSLDDKIGIWIEKRTMSTSDPVMRGFAGGNILALVDGCTLTTLWGEGGYAGDDMYGKVDSESIERIEVIRGPSSVLYGSNALGGVINFITKSCPLDYTDRGYDVGGRSKASYGSASEYTMLRQEFWVATPHTRFFLGGTSRRYGDTEGGRGVGTQSPTGGNDYNWDFKMQQKLAENHELELAIQDVRRNKVRRYYRPTQTNFNDREAVTLTWKATDISPLVSLLTVKGYVQNKLDVRKDFANGRTGRSQTRTFSGDIQTVSLAADDHRITGGIHYHEDHGEDPDDEQFTWTSWDTGVKTKDAPDSIWNNFGVYLQDEWDLSSRWTTIASVRYDHFHFNSNVDACYQPAAAGYDPENDDYSDNNGVLSGGLGLVYRMTQEVNLVANLTRGYRLFPPKFGVTQHGDGVRAPHEFFDPILSHTAEVGSKVLSERFAASCFAYYSSIRNWQGLAPGTYNGSEWYDYDNDGIDPYDRVYVTETGRANMYGVEIETETRLDLLCESLPADWVFAAGFAWNYGRDFENEEPMRHGQPARALFALRWTDPDTTRNGWFELSADVVRRFTRISDGRWNSDVGYLNDPQDPNSGRIRSTPYLPGHTVFDVRGGIDLTEDLSITLAVENLTDKKYRRAHSRWDEPGINFLASLSYTF